MVWKNDQVSELETEKILSVARESLAAEGDFVEFGCYKGDTALLLAEVLRDFSRDLQVGDAKYGGTDARSGGCGKSCGKLSRRLWLYDSFEGLPEKSASDVSALGEDFRAGELFVTKREVKERFLRAGLPVPVIKKAWFRDLADTDLPEKICLAFLDGDFYESIRDSLGLVSGRMSDGGVIIVHDYGNPALPGVKKAVDEWLRGRDLETYKSLAIIRCEFELKQCGTMK